MSTTLYISPAGLQRLRARATTMEAKLELLRQEKNTAYTASGDTWHDNPFFNKLEQDERSAAHDLAEIKGQLANAVAFTPRGRPTDVVRIGSIVEIIRREPGAEDQRELWEITGYGETDKARGQLGYNAPLAAVLIGQEEGAAVGYRQQRLGAQVSIEVEVVALHEDWPRLGDAPGPTSFAEVG
ncbi:transcription elongation factor [Deltaproteobacteria bacterium]|nr:transcription elongation factor [Deltaproteobacteria bacterium]